MCSTHIFVRESQSSHAIGKSAADSAERKEDDGGKQPIVALKEYEEGGGIDHHGFGKLLARPR